MEYNHAAMNTSIDPDDYSPAELVCLSCGMCCDGTLHYWTRLSPREFDTATRLGLDTIIIYQAHTPGKNPGPPGGQPAFRQPCRAFDAPVCTIYEQRPQACRRYTCRLLEQLQTGAISFDTALQNAKEVRLLLGQLADELPDPIPTLPIALQLRLNWPSRVPLPGKVEDIFFRLTVLLKDVWGVRWHREPPAKRH